MPGAVWAFSIHVGATRFDRLDSLLGSIRTRCTCHRVPPRVGEPAAPPWPSRFAGEGAPTAPRLIGIP
eukprot:6661355-Alexandrium_andersonii.AAC.1